MEVVAEEIQTEEQRARLRALGCEYGQGFFLPEPVSAAGRRSCGGSGVGRSDEAERGPKRLQGRQRQQGQELRSALFGPWSPLPSCPDCG